MMAMVIKQGIVNKKIVLRSLGIISHRIKLKSLKKKLIRCRVIKRNTISKISNLLKEHSTM